METRTAVVGSAVGLHVCFAAIFVQAVAESGVPVTIRKPGGEPVNAASILMVMGLGAACGDTVEIAVDGSPEIADQLAGIVESNLDG